MRMSIQWLVDGVEMPPIDETAVSRWLADVAAAHGCEPGRLNYIFCNDEKIIEVNRQFLGHDYFTDIITFDYSRLPVVSGDMFISLDTVASNAETFRTSYLTELHRVIVHGLLHLCGIDDKGPGEREIMEYHENEALKMYSFL